MSNDNDNESNINNNLDFDYIWNMYLKVGNKKKSQELYHKLTIKNKELIKNHIPLYIKNHIDNNKHNCNINNLEWVTPSENIIHSFLINDNRFTVKVNQLDKDTLELINSFHSIRSASISTNISLQNIRHCLNNRSKHAGGYVWTKVDSNINELLDKSKDD